MARETPGAEVFDRIELLYDSGFVERLHTVPTNRSHTVGEHVYGSMVIAMEICKFHHLTPGPILETLLYHDAPEVFTGDVPAPIKRMDDAIREHFDVLEDQFMKLNGLGMRELGPTEYKVFKAADILDLAFTCFHERRRGNKHPSLSKVFDNCLLYLKEQEDLEAVRIITSLLVLEWAHAE